jgi:hypothetical protein
MKHNIRFDNNGRIEIRDNKDDVSIAYFYNDRPLPMASFLVPKGEFYKVKQLVAGFDHALKHPVKQEERENIDVTPRRSFNSGSVL